MKTKRFSKWVRTILSLFCLTIIFDLSSSALAQQFPVGAYWVRDPNARERYDMYNQVHQCGINIVVGGTNYQSTPLRTILDAADANDIQLIVNDAAPSSKIKLYGSSYRMQYESTGYHSDDRYPDLVRIEGPILYDFQHEVGERYRDFQTKDQLSWRATAPGTPGYLIYNYSGADWQDSASYYATFRLKIQGDVNQHTLVARLLVVRDGSDSLVNREIYADDFAASNQYQDFEYSFVAASSSHNDQSSAESYEDMLPEGSEAMPDYVDLDYRVYWYGQVSLYVDYVAIEDSRGDVLFDAIDDSLIQNEAENAHNDDPDHDTILGFYNDEPDVYEIKPISHIKDSE